jgi:hypothetical protein
MAYSKEENGRIERANREILRHLRAFVMHSKVVDDWVAKLPFVQRIMNASVHSLTGFSPAALLFGTAVNLNRLILPEDPVGSGGQQQSALPTLGLDSSHSFYSSWLDQRNKLQQEVLTASAELQSSALQAHLAEVSPESVTTFAVGDWVLVLPVYNPLTGRRVAGDKLCSFWSGPFRVVSHEGNAYTLHDTVQDRDIVRHVTELKLFRFDPARTNPESVALIDRREFRIETILDHRGDLKYKTSLEFLVRWTGYSADYDLWLPWKEVMYTAQMRTYLESKGLLRLLPKSSR